MHYTTLATALRPESRRMRLRRCKPNTKEQTDMRLFKLIAVLAISAALAGTGAAAASAAFIEFLPGKAGTPFTSLSGKGILVTKNAKGELLSIACAKSKATGELTSPTTATATIDIEGCTTLGLPMNTDPDASGIVLFKASVKACAISEAPLKGGLLIKPTEAVTLLVPSVKLTIVISGDLIAGGTPENVSSVELFTGLVRFSASDEQEFTTCKDKAGESALTEGLKAKIDAEVERPAALEAKEALVQFTKANAQKFDT